MMELVDTIPVRQARPLAAKQYSPIEWKAKRGIIRRLYIEENKTLRLVMEIMESQHTFKPTVKMFKKRLKEWGYRKNYNLTEVERIYRVKRDDEAAGKTSESVTDKQKANTKRLENYIKRKLGTIESLQDAPQRSFTKSYLPSPAPSLRDPKLFEDPDIIFRSICKYVRGSFDTKMWIKIDEFRVDTAKHGDSINALLKLSSCLNTARTMFEQSESDEAGEMLRQGFSLVKQCLRDDDPELLTRILWKVLELQPQFSKISKMLLDHFAEFAIVILPQSHPLQEIFDRLKVLDLGTLENTVRIAWKTMLDQFQSILGPDHLFTLWLWDIFDGVCADFVPGLSERIHENLLELLHYCETVYRIYDIRTLRIQFYLVEFRRQRGMIDKDTEVLAAELVTRCYQCELESLYLDDTETFRITKYKAAALKLVAHIQYLDNRREPAEQNLRDCIRMRASLYGWTDSLTISNLKELEKYLRKSEKLSEAAEVHAQVLEIMKSVSRGEDSYELLDVSET